jgi:BlaI family penicillinase repressor
VPLPKPPSIPQISDAEWEVMKVVWDDGPLAAGDVVRRLAAVPAGHPARGWRPRTVKTLLARLVRKGAVAADDEAGPAGEGRRFLYRANVARDQCVRHETRSFLARVFNGSVAPALLHFLEDARLTPDEVELLRETLRREEAGSRDGVASAAAPPVAKKRAPRA